MGTDIQMGVTIQGAPAGLLESLPDFELINGEKWDNSYSSERIEGATEPPYFTRVEEPGGYQCYGEGRYGDEQNIRDWAMKFTTEHPDATVELSTEWDADGHGEELSVYRKGQLVNEESQTNRMVSLDLDLWLAEGKRVLAHYDEVSAGGYGAGDHQLLADALRKLVKGLE